VGSLVAVNFPETIWFYRGVIMKRDTEDVKITVLLLDIGISVHVRSQCLFPMLQRFGLDPPLAVSCQIVGMTTKDIEKTHAKLKSFFAEADRINSKVEAIVYSVLKRSQKRPNITSCVLLQVIILVDGAELAVKLKRHMHSQPGKVAKLPVEYLLPMDQADHGTDNFKVDFNGLNSDQFHSKGIERYSLAAKKNRKSKIKNPSTFFRKKFQE
jgi:hypothetical protein